MVPQNSRRNILLASLLLGCMMLSVACGANHPVAIRTTPTPSVVLAPTATTLPSPTVTLAPSPTVSVVGGCNANAPYTGQITPVLPLPPGTLVAPPIGVMASEVEYLLCTPSSTQSSITNFMNSALPAAGWAPYDAKTSLRGCTGAVFQWYKGKYGINLTFDALPIPQWALDVCPTLYH